MRNWLWLVAWFAFSPLAIAETGYWAVRYHDHAMMKELTPYVYSHTNKARVQIVTLRENITYEQLPKELRDFLRPIDPKVMSKTPIDRTWHDMLTTVGIKRADPAIKQVVDTVSEAELTAIITSLVEHGKRTTRGSIDWVLEQFTAMGYEPVYDYNVEAVKVGTTFPEEVVIIEGHMDTVANTVGADDNASGAAGVLEAARVLAGVSTKRTIVFLITEDEERGLLGAKRYVQNLKDNNQVDTVKFVVNMDMIGYNDNGIVDLESEEEFEGLVDWMAEQTLTYTSLEPNKVLHAWGSDHVPFINAGIPALLTIEHWDTHTPCWHRSCDTLDTVNFTYATEIVKLNVAALLLKAERD